MPQALDEWHRLDGSAKASLKPLLAKRLERPHVTGGKLFGELNGCYKIKLRRQGVRLIYFVEDSVLIVTVITIGRRESDTVYEAAATRFRSVKTRT